MDKQILKKLYKNEKLSSAQIGKKLSVSPSKVNYWLKKFNIQKRSLSESQYIKQNPNGDPFSKKLNLSKNDLFLCGLGLGLYWGEGTKASPSSVRLGNTDPKLIRCFINFLEKIYNVDKSRITFSIQIFHDLNKEGVEAFWRKELQARKSQFYKTTVSPSQSTGTYKKRSQHGVITIYFNNTKLRNILVSEIEKLRQMY
jgi:hypothetical protein